MLLLIDWIKDNISWKVVFTDEFIIAKDLLFLQSSRMK